MDHEAHYIPASLPDGTTFRVLEPSTAGFVIERRRHGQVELVRLPYPSAGLGGSRFIVSPSEGYVVLSYYSGQSEEAFALFENGVAFALVAHHEYECGEYGSFAFSVEEDVLVWVLPFTCDAWWQWLEDDAESDPDDDASLRFEFGTLFVHELGSRSSSRHHLELSVPRDFVPDHGADWDPDLHPVLRDPHRLELTMSWGAVVLTLPAAERTVVRVPRESVARR